MSKGSKRRLAQVSEEAIQVAWDRIFNDDIPDIVEGTAKNRTISFLLVDSNSSKEVFRVEGDGRFFVHGEEIETSEEVRDVFAQWCRRSLGDSRIC